LYVKKLNANKGRYCVWDLFDVNVLQRKFSTFNRIQIEGKIPS
jgi:hypothetical protein